jgi:hypothetical protein
MKFTELNSMHWELNASKNLHIIQSYVSVKTQLKMKLTEVNGTYSELNAS